MHSGLTRLIPFESMMNGGLQVGACGACRGGDLVASALEAEPAEVDTADALAGEITVLGPASVTLASVAGVGSAVVPVATRVELASRSSS